MRPYATVSPLFWTGATGKRLRTLPDAQRVAFYLMTSPHSHQSGLYWLPMMYICNEIGIPMEGASKALLCLSKEGFSKYDEASEWIWVCEMAAWQIGSGLSAQDKRCKGLQQYLSTLPSLPFMDEYVARYAEDFHLTPSQARGLQGASGGASSEQLGTEKEQEQRGSDDDPPPRKTSEPKKRASKRCPTDFEVTPDLREWARTKYPGVNLERETEKFRDHEYKDAKTDWPAAWRTWISKAADFRLSASQPQGQRARAFPS